MPRIYKLQKLNPNGRTWRYYPNKENHGYWVGYGENSARLKAARGSLPMNKVLSMSPWQDPEQTSCVLDYNSGGVAGGGGSIAMYMSQQAPKKYNLYRQRPMPQPINTPVCMVGAGAFRR